jgi:hypothetical protein
MTALFSVPTVAAPPADRKMFRQLQAIEDAIAFRAARARACCHDCDQAAEGICDDHACDVTLVAGYEQDALALISAIDQRITARLGGGKH